MKPLNRLAEDLAARSRSTAASPQAPRVAHEVTAHAAPEGFTPLPFSEVLFQGARGTFKPLPGTEFDLAWARHKAVTGAVASDDDRPSDAQLSGLTAWLTTKPGDRPRAPYVDLGAWTP